MQALSRKPVSQAALSRESSRWSSPPAVRGLPAPAELVLLFREGAVRSGQNAYSLQARRRRQAWRRTLQRRWASVTARLERTPEYRASWQRVLDLGAELQAVLEPAQRERWLALEEALFDHSSQLHRAYFRAGIELGQRKLAATVSSAETSPAEPAAGKNSGPPTGIELEILSALARWLGKLMRP